VSSHKSTPQSLPPQSTPDVPPMSVIWLVVHKAPNRRNRRHVKPERSGSTFYIPKAQQQPAVNRPFVRKKTTT